MEINRKEFLEALQIVRPGLATGDLIEQGTSFCFLEGNVVTYNDDISIRCPIPDLELEGAINANELFDFLNKIKVEQIQLDKKENEIIVKAGRSKAGLILESEILLPYEEIGDYESWLELEDVEEFLKALHFCAAACAKSDTKPVLTCVHVNGKLIEGAEGHRIANYHLNKAVPIDSFLIPAFIISSLIKFEPVEIAQGENWVHFKNSKEAIMSCRIMEDEYVKTAPHLKIKGESISFPSSLSEIVDRARIFAKRDDAILESITVKIENNRLFITSNSESGWFEEKARIDYSGEVIEFMITPYLLKGILNETSVAEIENNSKMIFKGENWTYLTMLRNNNA